jgi:hypothetical protein
VGQRIVVCVAINPIAPDIFLVAGTCCVGFRELYPTYYSAYFIVIRRKGRAGITHENRKYSEWLQKIMEGVACGGVFTCGSIYMHRQSVQIKSINRAAY